MPRTRTESPLGSPRPAAKMTSEEMEMKSISSGKEDASPVPTAPPSPAVTPVLTEASTAPSAPPSIRGRRDFVPVLIGGVGLTMVAGYINASFLTSSYARAVTHMTGLTTRMATALVGETPDYWDFYQCLLIIISFTFGSVVCGMIIGSEREFKRVRTYGIALVVESIALFIAVFVPLAGGFQLSCFFASFAAGLQNGLVSTFSSAIIRTTHVTGLLTDIGVLVGQGLHFYVLNGPRQKGLWKLKIFLPLYFGFLAGAILGTVATLELQLYALLFPASATLIAGVAHIIFRTMALDTVKRKGLKVELLDLDTRENPGYFAALKVQEKAPARRLQRAGTTMGFFNEDMYDFMAVESRQGSPSATPTQSMPHFNPAALAAAVAAAESSAPSLPSLAGPSGSASASASASSSNGATAKDASSKSGELARSSASKSSDLARPNPLKGEAARAGAPPTGKTEGARPRGASLRSQSTMGMLIPSSPLGGKPLERERSSSDADDKLKRSQNSDELGRATKRPPSRPPSRGGSRPPTPPSPSGRLKEKVKKFVDSSNRSRSYELVDVEDEAARKTHKKSSSLVSYRETVESSDPGHMSD